MNYFLAFLLAVISFFAGMYYQSKQLDNVPDNTINLTLINERVSYANEQIIANTEFLIFLELKEYEQLKKKINLNREALTKMKQTEEAVYNGTPCNRNQYRTINKNELE